MLVSHLGRFTPATGCMLGRTLVKPDEKGHYQAVIVNPTTLFKGSDVALAQKSRSVTGQDSEQDSLAPDLSLHSALSLPEHVKQSKLPEVQSC